MIEKSIGKTVLFFQGLCRLATSLRRNIHCSFIGFRYDSFAIWSANPVWFTLITAAALAGSPDHIVGGTPAEEGAWPDTVSVLRQANMHCTGVVIDPYWVLTAGHCSNMSETIRYGSVYSEEGGTVIDIVETIEYPDDAEVFDIQLHRLQVPVATPTHPPALGCIADYGLQAGSAVTLVGFGATSTAGGFTSSFLLQAEAPIVDGVCLSFDKDCHPEAAPHGEFIAGGDGVDTCDGDSGGPVYSEVGGQTYVLGVTSRAVRPSKTDCGEGGIYVQLDAVAPWIAEQTGVVFGTPDCEALGLNRRPRPEHIDYVGVFGRPIRGKILPGDGEPEQTHTFEVLTPPQHGTLELKKQGRFVYRPNEVQTDEDPPQQDVWWVRVTDSGAPSLSGFAKVTLQFEEAQGMCAVGSTQPVWWGGLALLFLSMRRRKYCYNE